MTLDNNKIHFLTNVTSLLIPQRINFFNKEEKVYFDYSGLSFRDMQATFPASYPERPIPSLTCQISSLVVSVVTSVTLHSNCYFEKFFNSFFHYCVLPEDVKKQIGNFF
jgi:hypothetical protein